MTPCGVIQDEGIGNSLKIIARGLARGGYRRKLIWLMPRMRRAVPYLGYVVIAGTKPN